MKRPRPFYICSIIFTLYFAHVQQPTTAQITASWEGPSLAERCKGEHKSRMLIQIYLYIFNALRAIRGSLIDPQGSLDNWNRGDPCVANWTRVICYNVTATDDGCFHVQELQLLRLGLSGTLAPELGQLSRMKIMDFMWNKITGSIPKEVGNITSLELLLIRTIYLDPYLNHSNLNKAKHFHMNNNSLSGQIPPELSRLPSLVHMLLDNNNLSGYLPPELAQLPKLLIIQLDNNYFSGTSIPSTYGNITTLLKLSLRNCSLEGPAPVVSGIPQLGYLDVSWNQLTGPIPSGQLASNITTMYPMSNGLQTTLIADPSSTV